MTRSTRAIQQFLLSSVFVSAAHAAENKLSVDLPAVPDTVRTEQKKFDERSGKTVPADAKIMEPGANKQAVDMPLPPKSKTAIKGDANKAPLVNLAPPDSIRGWTGQMLEIYFLDFQDLMNTLLFIALNAAFSIPMFLITKYILIGKGSQSAQKQKMKKSEYFFD